MQAIQYFMKLTYPDREVQAVDFSYSRINFEIERTSKEFISVFSLMVPVLDLSRQYVPL